MGDQTRCGQITGWKLRDGSLEASHERGRTRIELVANDILRVRFNPNGSFVQSRSWDVLRELPPLAHSELRCHERGRLVVLNTPTGEVRLGLDTGALAFRSLSGDSFAEDLDGPVWRAASIADTTIESRPGDELPSGSASVVVELLKVMSEREGYYGFGQRTGRLDRRYRRITNWTTDILRPGHTRGHDNLYQAHPFFMAVRPGLAWGLFLHSSWYNWFDVGAEQERQLRIGTLGGELDYYVLTGPTPAAVVEQLTRLTGRPLLPPIWAMGLHQSRWSYETHEQVESIASEFRERKIPLDAIHLDIDYMRGYRDFTWDPENFPAPREMMTTLHGQRIHAVTILDPGVKNDLSDGYAVANDGVTKDVFIKYTDGQRFVGYCWPGQALFPDFNRQAVRHWWGEQLRAVLDEDVEGIWIDMNEPAIFDRPFGQPGLQLAPIPLGTPQGESPERTSHAEVHNLYGYLMSRATYEGLERHRPEKRPWVLTRSTFTGGQRYAVTWMGDNSSWWEHLEMSLPQLSNMGLSGMPHVGADIGGFYENGHAELYARWMQLGTFYPFMRCHTALHTRVQEPWTFGVEVEKICERAIALRYQLIPYLYTLAHIAHRTGAPLWRPFLYEFFDQPSYFHVEDQIMIGPHLMVAPISSAGQTRRMIELPDGGWYDFWTGEKLGVGPIIQEAPLDRIPVFARSGAILTLGNLRQSTSEPLTELIVAVYPAAHASWTFIEDDGESNEYCSGHIAETDFQVDCSDGRLDLLIRARRGKFVPSQRTLTIQIHVSDQPTAFELDGVAVNDWRWNGSQSAALLSWDDDGCEHRVSVSV
jgi:alpha-glucosidase